MIRAPGRPRLDAEPLPRNLLLRECETCGLEHEKPANVSWARWLRRRFCSQGCYHEARASA